MPNVDDVMWRINQSTFISCYDTTSGYWQTAMAENSAWLTGFITHRGLHEWIRSPFGLKNSGAKFIRMLQIVLQPSRDLAEAYVDDIGVHSKTWPRNNIRYDCIPNCYEESRFNTQLKKKLISLSLK